MGLETAAAEAAQGVGWGLSATPAAFFHSKTAHGGTFGKIDSGRRRKNFHSDSETIPVNVLIEWGEASWKQELWLRYSKTLSFGSCCIPVSSV